MASCDALTQRPLDDYIPLYDPKPMVAMSLRAGDTLIFAEVRLVHDVREYWETGGGISGILPDRYDVFLYRNGQLLCGPFADPAFVTFQAKHCFLDAPVPSSPDTYELVVTMDGYPTLRAVQQMPRCVPFDTVVIKSLEVHPELLYFTGVLEIHFTDPAGEVNFYELVVKDSCLLPATTKRVLKTESLDNKALPGATLRLIASDAEWDGQSVSLLVGFRGGGGGGRDECALWLEFVSITEDRYRFLKTLTLAHESYNNAFAEPVFIHYNIENGLGIFSAECPSFYRLY